MLKRISALVAIFALGLVLAGCDKCGNWPKLSGEAQVCKEDVVR
jgi:hypothetical protein